MSDDSARPRRGLGAAYALIVLVAAVFAAIIGWQWMQITALKDQLAQVEILARSAQANDALLSKSIDASQQALITQLDALSNSVERKIVASTSGRIEEAINRLSAFGNAGFAFQMEEFDRRSCVNGGVFSGEPPEGELVETAFEAGAMVQVLQTHRDIRGIPFYRVSVDDVPIGDGEAEFRHGSMRIACN